MASLASYGPNYSNYQRDDPNADFADDPVDFVAPEQFNPYDAQMKMLDVLRQLVAGIERGEFRIEKCDLDIALDAFSSAATLRDVPVRVPGGAVLSLDMRLITTPAGIEPDDDSYPDAPLPEVEPTAQVGAAPPRQLILDEK
jgi:hypothetical protein